MTEMLNLQPFQPSRIGQMGLFDEQGIGTPTFIIDRKRGRLKVISTAARGDMPQFNQTDPRSANAFVVPHLPKNDTIFADELITSRQYGTVGSDATSVAAVVQQKLEKLRKEHEATWEHHRLGAIKGVVLDADNSTTIYNWYTEFGITKQTLTFDSTATNSFNQMCMDLKRAIMDALGGSAVDSFHCFVGDGFMDKIASGVDTKEAYDRWQDGQWLRTNYAYDQFLYKGVVFENYRGTFENGDDMVSSEVGHAFPLGTDRFIRRNAPSPTNDAVGTLGLPMYSYQEPKRFGQGVDLHTNSNPLFMCSTPEILVEITATA